MNRYRLAPFAFLMMTAGASFTASGQGRPDPGALIAAQREAMMRLAFADGVWRGSASTILPSGERHIITQTERVGPFLDGSVKVIEGRGYESNGSPSFNAFAIISYNPDKRTYSMRSYAQGSAGDFALTPTADGFAWEIPAGPVTIRYTALIKDGMWREFGDQLMPDKQAVRFFEMNLTRVGDSNWPAAGAVSPK